MTDPQQWYDEVIAAKDGLPQNAAAILISGGDPRWPECKDISPNDLSGAAASPRLTAFASTFTNHQLGSVCQAGDEATLTEAIAALDTACQGFTPPG